MHHLALENNVGKGNGFEVQEALVNRRQHGRAIARSSTESHGLFFERKRAS
jgi:hypothetical protein